MQLFMCLETHQLLLCSWHQFSIHKPSRRILLCGVFWACYILRCCFKIFFRDPRPFMYSLNVYPNLCDLTYGTPDCEILFTKLMIGVIFLNRTRQASTLGDSKMVRIFQYIWASSQLFSFGLIF